MAMSEFNRGQGSRLPKKTDTPVINGQSLSQEGPLVGNPLLEVKTQQRELSEQEQTILWANQVFEEYGNLPKENSKERKRAKYLVHQTADRLLQRPQDIDIAGSVWKSHELPPQDPDSKKTFYKLVKEKSAQRAKDHWKELSSDKLTELVKVYAYSRLAPDMAEEILSGYFRGPNGMRQIVDSVYKLVYGLIDLAMDQQALARGLQIVRFEGPILKRNSAFHADIEQAAFTLDDDVVLGQASGINATIVSLSRLVSSYDETNIRSFFISSDTEENKKRIEQTGRRLIRKFTKETIIDRLRRLKEVNSGGVIRIDERRSKEWPFVLAVATTDPLRKKYAEQISPFEIDSRCRVQMGQMIKDNTGANAVFVSVPTQDGLMMTIAIPDYYSEGQRNAVVKSMLTDFLTSENDKQLLENPDIPAIENTVLHDGVQIPVLRRRMSIVDRDKHPLSVLEAIGLPSPNLEGKDLSTVNQELVEDIQKHQIRFLNKRGVSVPIEAPELKRLGYTFINFNKDSNADKTSATISLGELSYRVKLDKYLNIDLEGKFVNSPLLIQRMHYVLLSLLRPILCEERIKDPHLAESLEEKEVVSRMGHLRWLPTGQRFSKTAVENYFRIEGKDLFVTNLQRMEEHPDKRAETTYVKPIIEKEENLPPITIHLPGVLKFN